MRIVRKADGRLACDGSLKLWYSYALPGKVQGSVQKIFDIPLFVAQLAACERAISLEIFLSSPRDNLGRQLRGGRRFVPARRLQPVADELLVIRRWIRAGRVLIGGPES